MQQQPENQSKKYARLFNDIDSGQTKIPQFQRDFVWDKARTATLIDSILKGFPIGTFILWKTKERLRHMRSIGNVQLKEPDRHDAIQYILDGQQRITSLYAVRKGAVLTRDRVEVSYEDIVIDLTVDPDDEEDVVLETPPEHPDYISVHELLNATVAHLASKYKQHLNTVSMYKERLEGYDFSTVVIDNYPIEVACEVFTRVNTGGQSLDLFEIMVAKTFDQDRCFDLKERYDDLVSSEMGGKDLETSGYDTIPSQTILHCVASNACRSIRRPDVLKISRDQFIDCWNPTKDGIFAAIDYLRTHVGIAVSKILPYDALLIPIAWFFVQSKGRAVSNKQNRLLRQYIYWAALTNRFGSGVGTKIAADLDKMEAILQGQHPKYAPSELKILAEDLQWRPFTAGDAYCKAVVCLLASKRPRRFNTDAIVILDNSYLKTGASRNYHHFFPKAFLKKKGYNPEQANSMMNIVLVDDQLNKNEIRAKSPSTYIKKFAKENENIGRTLSTHFIGDPDKWGIYTDEYDVFLGKRAKRITRELNKILNPFESGTRHNSGNDAELEELEDPRLDKTVEDYMKAREWTKEDILELAFDEMGVFSSASSAGYKRLLDMNKRGILTTLRNNYPDEFIEAFWAPDDEE